MTDETNVAEAALPSVVPTAETSAETFKPVDLDAPNAAELLTEQSQLEESPERADASPAEKPSTGETEGANPADELPSIEPPRSWTKEDKELFTSLPRETQERLAERERLRESDFLRRQNEAADKLKGLTTKEQAVEQARQQYEAALPQLLQTLQSQQAGEFGDIKSIQDVEKLAREDWPRYLQWDVAQKKAAAVQQEMQLAQQRQTQEREQHFVEFSTKEDRLFLEKAPDMADPAKAKVLQDAALKTLNEAGFVQDELAKSWNGESNFSVRDHRWQLIIRDASQWREAQLKAKAAKPLAQPKPQSPGSSQRSASDLASVADAGDMEKYVAMRSKGARR